MAHCKRYHGFTMVELVLVILILGTIAAIGLPRFFELGAYENLGEYDEAINAVRYAQQYAIASGCDTRVTINANRLHIEADCNGMGYGEIPHPGRCYIPANDERDYDCTIPGITPATNFIFDALGSTGTAGTDITVNAGGGSFTVHGGTGFIEE
jgi:MSHA pilin protein MshC